VGEGGSGARMEVEWGFGDNRRYEVTTVMFYGRRYCDFFDFLLL
jgi:hypothetical protein